MWNDAAREREVPVRICAPAMNAGNGPFPTVVFSHGGGESREAFSYLGNALARSGYVIVFVTHRGSDREALQRDGLAALGTSAFEDRPKDIVFVLDQLLSSKLDEALLAERIDKDRVAVAGQCAGASTALAVTGLTTKSRNGRLRSYRDRRPKAVVALSPQPGGSSRRARESFHDDSWKTVAVPALVVTGTRDFLWTPGVRRDPKMINRPYTGMAPGDKYLVEIAGAQHHAFTDSRPYYPGGPRDPRHHTWIAQAMIGFLDAHLKDNASALDWLRTKRLQTITQGDCRQEQMLLEDATELKSAADQQSAFEAEPGSYEVAVVDRITLHDSKRDKRIEVRVTYAKTDGKLPVIVYSHCVGGCRRDYEPLIRYWVSHGYACVQADHSDSRLARDSHARRLDFRNRARDLSFLIDSLAEIEGDIPDFEGKLDPTRIGAGGHLIGAYASCLLAGMKVFPRGEDEAPETFADDRVVAALLLSPQGRGQGLTDRSWADIATPMLVVAGSETASRRTGNGPEWRTEPFTFSRPGEKYLLFVKGLDNGYAGLALGRGMSQPTANWIQSATLAFWNEHLKNDVSSQDMLTSETWKRLGSGEVDFQLK
jgi:predicted dienelactone hydrolase